jgi:hypothetical protein
VKSNRLRFLAHKNMNSKLSLLQSQDDFINEHEQAALQQILFQSEGSKKNRALTVGAGSVPLKQTEMPRYPKEEPLK